MTYRPDEEEAARQDEAIADVLKDLLRVFPMHGLLGFKAVLEAKLAEYKVEEES